MPKVPEYKHTPLKSTHNVRDPRAYASMKQKNYIAILCERRKLPVPYMEHLKAGEAAQIISRMLN